MPSNLDRYKADLERLTKLGDEMVLDMHLRARADEGKLDAKEKEFAKTIKNSFETNYQRWYTEAAEVVRQLAPSRLSEFEHLYKGDGRRKTVDIMSYTIQDWLVGARTTTNPHTGQKHFNDSAVACMRLDTQIRIVQAIERRFESSLFEIRQLMQADLFDSELDAARELLKHRFSRAAGAVAGVVLEKHLAQVADSRKVIIKKKHPTVAELNDPLKAAGVIDVPQWRQIQRLGDLRNLCDHNKHREPTPEEVAELINGAEKLTKTLF